MGLSSARDVALNVLQRVDVHGAYADISLDSFLTRFSPSPPDRALATELVYGVCRRRNSLDWAVESVSSRPVSKMTPWVRNALRMGAYQLLYLDRIPAAVATSETVDLVKKYGHAGTVKFANAVMRALASRVRQLRAELTPATVAEDATVATGVAGAPITPDVRRLSLVYSHPEWLVQHFIEELGMAGAMAFMESDNSVPPLAVRANTLRITVDGLRARLATEGIDAEPCRYAPDGLVIAPGAPYAVLSAHRDGLMQAQDEGSMLVAYALEPRPGEFVVDACAAPGGKTTHVAQLMRNRGRIVACDIHLQRLGLVRELCDRLGVTIVEELACDSRDLGSCLGGGTEVDRVLVDAPCTGLGTLRRRPDARWRKEARDATRMAELQLGILLSAARCLRRSGVLVYSTCTIGRTENQDVIEEFLKREPQFVVDDVRPALPAALRGDVSPRGWLQLLPHRHGTDGFFICRLRKVSAGG